MDTVGLRLEVGLDDNYVLHFLTLYYVCTSSNDFVVVTVVVPVLLGVYSKLPVCVFYVEIMKVGSSR